MLKRTLVALVFILVIAVSALVTLNNGVIVQGEGAGGVCLTITADDFGGSYAGDGQADTFRLVRDENRVICYLNEQSFLSLSLAEIEIFTIEGSTDDDKLIVDFSRGSPVPGGGLTFNGRDNGMLGDALELAGGQLASTSYEYTGSSDGIIHVDGSVIRYTGLEPVIDLVPAVGLIVIGTADNNIINYTSGLTPPNGLIDVDVFETIEFNNKANLTLNAQGGDDLVILQNTSIPTGLTSINIYGGLGNDALGLIDIGIGFSGTVSLFGESGADQFHVNPSLTASFFADGGDDEDNDVLVVDAGGTVAWDTGTAVVFAAASGLLPVNYTGMSLVSIANNGAAPAMNITKITVDGAAAGDGLNILNGETITWRYTLTNTGNVSLNNIQVTDDKGVTPVYQSGDDGNGILDPQETWIFEATGTAAVGLYANNGNVQAFMGVLVITDSDGSSYFGADPQIAVDKVTVDGVTFGDGLNILTGESIKWRYTVTNTGNVPLSSVSVSDSEGGVTPVLISGDANSDTKLDLTETWVYEASGTAITGSYSNTGIASCFYQDSAPHVSTDTAMDGSSYFGADPQIGIDKVTVDSATSGDGLNILTGESIKWRYTVTNTGNVPLSSVSVSDSEGGVTPVLISGDANSDSKLDLAETWVYEASGTAITGSYSNTGIASCFYQDSAPHIRTDTAMDGSSYLGTSPNVVDFKTVKLVIDADGNTVVSPGDTLSYSAEIKNTGNGAANGVIFIDTPDTNTTLVVGSVIVDPSGSIIEEGNTAGDTRVVVKIGTIPANGTVQVIFEVMIKKPCYTDQITNQAVVTGFNFSAVNSDDPGTEQIVGDPTIISIQHTPPKGVGGDVEPISKLTVIIPWLSLALIITIMLVSLRLSRRRGN